MLNSTEDIAKKDVGQYIINEAYRLYAEFVKSGGQHDHLGEPHLLRLTLMVHDFYMAEKYLAAWIFSENNHNRIIKSKKQIYQEFDEHFFYLKRSAQQAGILYFAKALKSAKGDVNGSVARFGGGKDVIKPIIELLKKYLFDNDPIMDEAIEAAEQTRDKMIAHSDAELFDPRINQEDGVSYVLNDFTKFLSDEHMVALKNISSAFVYIISDLMKMVQEDISNKSAKEAI